MADYSDYKECTDCVHYELCLHQEKFLIEHNRKDLIRRYGFGLSEPEICCNFRDRSLLVELPLKVGDTFYTFNYDEDAVSEQIVDEIRIIDDTEGDNIVFYGQCVIFTLNEIGSFAFITKAEAKQTLKERENDTPEAAIIRLNQVRTDKDERDPAIDMAIRAINRVFVKRKPANDGCYSPFVCPECNAIVHENVHYFCPDCGQALDWGEGKADG